jgi:hypothetical protein
MTLKPEQQLQINIVNWFNFQFPELEPDFHHFANERKCSWQEGRTLKRMGVKRGVADLFLAYPTDDYAGLWIELKVGRNQVSKEQREFGDRKMSRGYQFFIVRSLDEAKGILLHYLCDYLEYRVKNVSNSLYNPEPSC